LADFHPKGEVSQAYGLWRDNWGTSKRAVVIIDEEGLVQYSEVIVKGPPDVEEIIKAVEAIA
jgi:alkyl hydroperoxide reductase subunit AhpC